MEHVSSVLFVLMVDVLLSEVTQVDGKSQSDASQEHCPSHWGNQCEVHSLKWMKIPGQYIKLLLHHVFFK